MWYDLCTGTLISVLIPPGLFAMVGTEQSGLRIWSVCKFSATVLAASLTLGGLSGQTVSMAEGLNGADRDAYGF